MIDLPDKIFNVIAGEDVPAASGGTVEKFDPHTGTHQRYLSASGPQDVAAAVAAAQSSFPAWAAESPVVRGRILGAFAAAMRDRAGALAEIVAEETGKSVSDARGETAGAIQLADYFAGEGMRLHGRSFPSGVPGKTTHTMRAPRGLAALVIAANTPIANVAWKLFPALVCGNAVILKAPEDTPAIAYAMARLALHAGVPPGVFNCLQGSGAEAGGALVAHPRIDVISFTGSTRAGRQIAEVAARRLARVSLELGGKNPMVICEDADLDNAVKWALASSFSNAGQRCAASSRIIVDARVHGQFLERFVAGAAALKVGNTDDCFLGPVINARQKASILAEIDAACARGGEALLDGRAPLKGLPEGGYYVAPQILTGLEADDRLVNHEVFGPVTVVHPVADYHDALAAANASNFGLTAAIHTKSIDRAVHFCHHVRAGTVNVNLGTHGSEPHFPFGGFGQSGNGTREPGAEALDVYSELKTVSYSYNVNGL